MESKKNIEKALADMRVAHARAIEAENMYYRAIKILEGVSTPSLKRGPLSDDQIAKLLLKRNKRIKIIHG
jgi:coenzyme F420-reducing hydrogenase alpha subunit